MTEKIKKRLLWIGLIFWGGWSLKALFDIIIGILRTDFTYFVIDLPLFSIGLLLFVLWYWFFGTK